MKSQFVMLAEKFDSDKHSPAGWFASEKLDGQRCIWIPGTRGYKKSEIPFANTAKDARFLLEQKSSGLWSRYGNVVHAPDDWLDQLPQIILDGELFTRRGDGGRQELSSIIKPLVPSAKEWQKVKFYIFDLPSPEALFGDRDIDAPNYNKDFNGILQWYEGILKTLPLLYRAKPTTGFASTHFLMLKFLKESSIAFPHRQFQLAFQTSAAMGQLEATLHAINEQGGEGIMLREPASCWIPERSKKLLKVKNLNDDEGTVVGYITGRETDKGSKLLGLMGALILDYNGKRLELSGFTESERRLSLIKGYCAAETDDTPQGWASKNPEKEVPAWIEAKEFPRGSKVTFKYRGLTADGIPAEARYWRHKESE